MQFDPFPPPPIGLPVNDPHAIPVGSRVLVQYAKPWAEQPPEIAYVHSYTSGTVRLNYPDHRGHAFADRSVYFASLERRVDEALEGVDRWVGLVKDYVRARNALSKLLLRTGDQVFADALAASKDRYIPKALADELEEALSHEDASMAHHIATSSLEHHVGHSDLAEKHRRVTEALRRIRDEINTLLGE